jgi:hypothetical protein
MPTANHAMTASYDRLFDTGNVSGQTFQLQATYRF